MKNKYCEICERRIATHEWKDLFKVCLICLNNLEDREKEMFELKGGIDGK